jgi:hypothetical protein
MGAGRITVMGTLLHHVANISILAVRGWSTLKNYVGPAPSQSPLYFRTGVPFHYVRKFLACSTRMVHYKRKSYISNLLAVRAH